MGVRNCLSSGQIVWNQSDHHATQSESDSAEHPPFLKKKLAECSGVEFSILYEPLCIFIHRKFFKKSVFIRFHVFLSS